MAKLWYGHFDSAPDDRRPFTAAEWARYFSSFITNGIRNGGNNLEVTAKSGMTVKVDTGMANINGYIFILDEDFNGRYWDVLLPASHPQHDRIDRLVLRLDTRQDARTITPVISMGAATSNPAPPILVREGYVYELSLARIYVKANTLAILPENITDERLETELCGIINSILGLDPSTWQRQADILLDSYVHVLQIKTTVFENIWKNWFDGITSDPVRFMTFDFDNLAAFSPAEKTSVLSGDIVTETIRGTHDGVIIATRVTDLQLEDEVTETITVYGVDGVTVIKRVVTHATFDDDGNVIETVRWEVP